MHGGGGSDGPLGTNSVASGHAGPTGQAALMIQLQMELDRALRPLELGPIEHRGAQFNNSGIHRAQRMREPEPPPLGRRQGRCALA